MCIMNGNAVRIRGKERDEGRGVTVRAVGGVWRRLEQPRRRQMSRAAATAQRRREEGK